MAAYSAPVSGILDIGRYPDGDDDVDAAVAADLTAATFASRPVADVMARKRQKLLMNLANVLDAACPRGADVSDIYDAARAEALACFAAAGAVVATDEEDMARRVEAGLGMRPYRRRAARRRVDLAEPRPRRSAPPRPTTSTARSSSSAASTASRHR